MIPRGAWVFDHGNRRGGSTIFFQLNITNKRYKKFQSLGKNYIRWREGLVALNYQSTSRKVQSIWLKNLST